MDLKLLNDDELIQLYKDNHCSFQAIERKYNLGKNSVGRLFNKRKIDYHKIQKDELTRIKHEYEENPNKCKYCGKPIPFEDRLTKIFCNSSCSASYNNTERPKNKNILVKQCLNCGKELIGNKSKNKYCCQSCLFEYQYKQYISRWKEGLEDGKKGKYDVSNHIRRYLFNKYNSSCQLCGWNKINPTTGLIPLLIHHIDGDCLNNREDNLQLLCPNCHSLTETYGNLNKQSSRIYRKQKENIE